MGPEIGVSVVESIMGWRRDTPSVVNRLKTLPSPILWMRAVITEHKPKLFLLFVKRFFTSASWHENGGMARSEILQRL